MSETKKPVKRWNVPRLGKSGEPIGVLQVTVVPAESYDALVAERDELLAQNTQLENLVDELKTDRDYYESRLEDAQDRAQMSADLFG